jgi:PAS domain S-box-containing protein
MSQSPLPIDRQRSLRSESNELFGLLIDSVRDYAMFVLDPEGYVLTWNPGAEALKGYTREEIVGKHFSTFYQSEAIESGWPQRELALAEKDGRFADEGWRVRKDGSTFWASVIITALRAPDGTLTGFAKVTQDMTERRRNEEQIQSLNRELRQRVQQLDESRRVVELRTIELQKLSGRLLQIQDEERRRIARELHDDLGQQLIALKMALPKFGSAEASQLTDAAISTVRNLSYLLHPPLLDESGLKAALHWYIEGMSKRSKISVSISITPPVFPRLSRDIETTIFRVVQESLTNVYRHSKCDRARVEIEKQSEWVIVRIRDYGQGVPMNIENRMGATSIGVGVAGMRERVRQFGGDLTLCRAEPGTLVEATLPIFL